MRYRFTIDSRVDRLDSLYRWLERLLHRRRVDLLLSQNVILVCQELTTNSIIHGNRGIKSKKVHIELSVTSKRVRLKIVDCGSGRFKIPTKRDASKLNYLEECGRGLKLAV